jgi:hypothetical protein
MLLRRLVASTSLGVIGYVTQSSALTGSASTSQFLTFGNTFRSFSRYLSLVS